MCFKDGQKPHVPPPPPPPPGFSLCRDAKCSSCLSTTGKTWDPITFSSSAGTCAVL